MNKLKNIIIFWMLPILVGVLLIINAKVGAERYSARQEADKKNQYIAQIKCDISSMKLKSLEKKYIQVNVKNSGTMTWVPNDKNNISLSYHVLDESDNKVVLEGDRAKLANSIKSGEGIDFQLKINAPDKPGRYIIELDMVQEGVTWFKEKGSKTFNIELEVTK